MSIDLPVNGVDENLSFNISICIRSLYDVTNEVEQHFNNLNFHFADPLMPLFIQNMRETDDYLRSIKNDDEAKMLSYILILSSINQLAIVGAEKNSWRPLVESPLEIGMLEISDICLDRLQREGIYSLSDALQQKFDILHYFCHIDPQENTTVSQSTGGRFSLETDQLQLNLDEFNFAINAIVWEADNIMPGQSCEWSIREKVDAVINKSLYQISSEKDKKKLQTMGIKVLYNVAFDLLTSGDYHIYRGVLDPAKPFAKLFFIVEKCLSYYVINNICSLETAHDQLDILADNIKSIG